MNPTDSEDSGGVRAWQLELTPGKRGAIIKKLFIGFLIIELLIIIAGNVLCFSSYAGVADKSYLVESKRLAGELRKSDKKI